MFLVEVPDTFPREYVLAEISPRRRPFAVTPTFIVHTKKYGTHEKAQPYVVRGVARDGRLLIQATEASATEYQKVGSWHEIECGDTSEGYRFKRYALKPLAVLIKIGQKAAAARTRVAREVQTQAERDEKCGTCPVCFGDYVVHLPAGLGAGIRPKKMVHHGYERPGVGYIVGDCHGVGFMPFELSCEGTRSWLTVLQNRLDADKRSLADLPKRETVSVKKGSKLINGHLLPVYEQIARGAPGFDREIERIGNELASEIRSLEHSILHYTSKIETWAPARWPRIEKGSAS